MLNILSILMGAVVVALAIRRRRSPAWLISGIVIGVWAIAAGISGLLA